MMKSLTAILRSLTAFVVVTAPVSSLAQPDSLMQFLTPFIGEWHTVPDAEMLEDFPEMANSVAFKFEWADSKHKLLRFYEGIPQGDMRKRILEALVAVNPRTGDVAFMGYQMRNDFLFKGRFEPLGEDEGFVRLYDVYYPHGTKFRHMTSEMKGMKSYRDICRLVGRDTLECTTEQFDFGQYKPWGRGKPYRMVRGVASGAMENEDPANADGLAALVGRWVSH